MIVRATREGGKKYTYSVARAAKLGWIFIRSSAFRDEYFSLDHDKRHSRFFLSEKDQSYVGIQGLKALESMAREVLRR